MAYKSSDGKLTLEASDLDGDKDRYLRIAGKHCPLSYQQMIDLISTWEDDKDDAEFVEAFDAYAAHCMAESVKTLEEDTTASVATRSDN